MLESERRSRIVRHVEQHGFLSMKEALGSLDVSRSTLRRDFDALAEEGVVERVRGGLRKHRASPSEVLPYRVREIHCAAEKDAIAARAASLLRANDVVFVDGGTTTHHLAAHLPDVPLRLVTVSVPFLQAIKEQGRATRNLELLATGGVFDADLGILMGPLARRSLADFHASWCFISADGIGEWGVTNMNYLSIETKTEMIQRSDRTVVLADHSKVNVRAMTRVCGLDEVSMLITDQYEEDPAVLRSIRRQGVQVVSVPVRAA